MASLRALAMASTILCGVLVAAIPRAALGTPAKDGCTGMLQVDPQQPVGVVVSTPGVWCLDRDHASSLDVPGGDYVMILITADDVTIDCRGHRLEYSGLAGWGYGIDSSNGQRRTVRNCAIRGFSIGIAVGTTQDYLIEDNLIQDSRPGEFGYPSAIGAAGRGTIRRNRIVDVVSRGLAVHGTVLAQDNLIDGIAPTPGSSFVHAADFTVTGAVEFTGNTIRRLQGEQVSGVQLTDDPDVTGPLPPVVIRDNVLIGTGGEGSVAINCLSPGRFADNLFLSWQHHDLGCTDAGDNDVSGTVIPD